MTSEDPAIRFKRAVPQFTVPDVLSTAEYYRDVLGFQISGFWDGEQATSEPAVAPRFAIVWRDEIEVYFNQADTSDINTGRACGAYDVYFHITGIEALAADLRARCGCPRGSIGASLRPA